LLNPAQRLAMECRSPTVEVLPWLVHLMQTKSLTTNLRKKVGLDRYHLRLQAHRGQQRQPEGASFRAITSSSKVKRLQLRGRPPLHLPREILAEAISNRTRCSSTRGQTTLMAVTEALAITNAALPNLTYLLRRREAKVALE